LYQENVSGGAHILNLFLSTAEAQPKVFVTKSEMSFAKAMAAGGLILAFILCFANQEKYFRYSLIRD
jgi:hypothetical protein